MEKKLYYGGRILTMDRAYPVAEAVLAARMAILKNKPKASCGRGHWLIL